MIGNIRPHHKMTGRRASLFVAMHGACHKYVVNRESVRRRQCQKGTAASDFNVVRMRSEACNGERTVGKVYADHGRRDVLFEWRIIPVRPADIVRKYGQRPIAIDGTSMSGVEPFIGVFSRQSIHGQLPLWYRCSSMERSLRVSIGAQKPS